MVCLHVTTITLRRPLEATVKLSYSSFKNIHQSRTKQTIINMQRLLACKLSQYNCFFACLCASVATPTSTERSRSQSALSVITTKVLKLCDVQQPDLAQLSAGPRECRPLDCEQRLPRPLLICSLPNIRKPRCCMKGNSKGQYGRRAE